MNTVKILLSLSLLGMASTVNANLISNGSFEDDSAQFLGGGDKTMVLSSGSTVLTGWGITGSNVAWLYDDYWGITASDGDYFLDLTTYNPGGSGGVAQTNVSTNIGQSYTLSFDLGSSTTYGSSPSIIASAGAVTNTFSTTATNSNQWDTFSMSFVATDSFTTVELTGVGTNYSGAYIGLDNVSVIASNVPEPSILTLIGLGIFGLGLSRRKMKK